MSPDRTVEPPVRPFGTLTMPAAGRSRLANGIELHTYRGGDQPLCKLTLHFSGGMAEMGDAPGKMLLWALSEGCEGYTADEIAETLDYNGAKFSVRQTAHNAVVDLTALSSRMAELLPMLRSMLLAPAFDAERLQVLALRYKTIVRNACADAAARAEYRLQPMIFGSGHPLSAVPQEADVDAVDSDTLRRLHSRLVAPAGMKAYLSGVFDDEVMEAVKDMLESLPSSTQPVEPLLVPASPSEAVTVRLDDEGEMQSAIAIALPAIDRTHPDFLQLRLTVMALGGYFGSRLNANIREDKGLTYGISALTLATGEEGHVYISAKCDRAYTDTVLAEIASEVRNLADNPPSGDELDRLRRYVVSSLAEQLDSPFSIMGYYGTHNLVGTPEGYFSDTQTAVESLSPDDIALMARRYLDPSRFITVIA